MRLGGRGRRGVGASRHPLRRLSPDHGLVGHYREASYALYILHWPLHAWLIKILGVSEQVADGSALFFWCYLALLIIVSILTLRLIEQPARRIVYNKLKGS